MTSHLRAVAGLGLPALLAISAPAGAAVDLPRPILLRSGSQIVDAPVDSRDGVGLGRITELVFDTAGSRVAYAVVDSSWELFQSSDVHAIPWSELRAAPSHDSFTIDVTAAHFALAPGFPAEEWPNVADRHWTIDVPGFYARDDGMLADVSESVLVRTQERLREMEGSNRVMWDRRLTEIMGTEVHNPMGESLGEIDDLAVDVVTGRIVYAVLEFGGLLGVAEHEAFVPWSLVDMEPRAKRALARVDFETLRSLEVPDDEATPRELVAYASRLYERFDLVPYWETAD